MLVTFISQCEKKALSRTRRVLDSFAQRIGDNVWQTAITEDGLKTVYQLLRQTASRSTAISCHRVRTRQRTELVWIVGNRQKFNALGQVAVHRTKRDILKNAWESHWQNLPALHIVSVLSALLHDLGKSSDGFQQKLLHPRHTHGDFYRHEWISLKLMLWLWRDCKSDDDIWQRLEHIDVYLKENPNPDLNQHEQSQLGSLPPVAQWLAWLVVTHHRLPPLLDFELTSYQANALYTLPEQAKALLSYSMQQFYDECLNACAYWVKNPNSTADKASFFQFDSNRAVWQDSAWQAKVKRYAKKARQEVAFKTLAEQNQWANPFLLHLSRLCLMMGDYTYSSLPPDSPLRIRLPHTPNALYANTIHQQPKQTLPEHLLGVSHYAAQMCRALPALQQEFPKLKHHALLTQATSNRAFAWQNKAFDLAKQWQQASETHGFFGVNMASTGCGKTLGNMRIMYGLANPQHGSRITIAMGLRVLTLQTGQSLREKLALNEQQLAILVGGTAQKQLFEFNQEQERQNQIDNMQEQSGSLSAHESSLHQYFVDGDNQDYADLLQQLHLHHLFTDENAQKLLLSPVVSCTIDHLMPASECGRGGAYIAPMLRLLNSDLILDEPDDFNAEDYPALSRLVHLAGLFGSRVLLSSATLPPDLVQGLYQAYLAGRTLYNQQFQLGKPNVVTAWIDENKCTAQQINQTEQFAEQHQQFIKKRNQFLEQQTIRRRGEILPLDMEFNHEQPHKFYQKLAQTLLNKAIDLHSKHHIQADDKTVSIGLIRMANIQPLMQVATTMHKLETSCSIFSDGIEINPQIHLCCYHSKQLLLLRNRLENRLDKLLKRDQISEQQWLQQTDIAQALTAYPDKTHHIFIVLATSVAEVGRDHDYDWAIVEPSSMRSIIQLAGRIWRHRPDKTCQQANLAIWQKNIRAFKEKNVCFTQPGFERHDLLLHSHDMNCLLTDDFLNRIDARQRIQKSTGTARLTQTQAQNSFADLEQFAMQELMNADTLNAVNAYWHEHSANRQHIYLSRITPFRLSHEIEQDYVIRWQDEQMKAYVKATDNKFAVSDIKETENIKIQAMPTTNPQVNVWLSSTLADELAILAQRYDVSMRSLEQKFAQVSLRENTVYCFDERFGFWESH